MPRLDTVQVCVDLEAFATPALMGHLRSQRAGSGEIFSFEYDESWLQRAEAFAFDPDLALVAGPQYPARDRSSFGIFLDSSPDRWGQVLMQRRENMLAREERRRPRALTEWDFLLGVHDETRLGALRFRAAEGQPFMQADALFAAPPITSLRELQAASLKFEQHMQDEVHPDYQRWLSQLFAPGSSLGGARPKASVRDETGALCIAKFPSREDTRDVGAWELVAHSLASAARVVVPPVRPLRLRGSAHTTFVAKRFDRPPQGGRLAFVSAMTLTQRIDGEAGASYLELIDLLQSRGADTKADCEQLFRRVVFNILIHNTYDHLRNHGFFIDARGIRLSPAYDINPSVESNELSLAINEIDATCDVSIAMDSSQSYGVDRKRAERVLQQVRGAIVGWRKEAERLGIPRSQQELMAAAFTE